MAPDMAVAWRDEAVAVYEFCGELPASRSSSMKWMPMSSAFRPIPPGTGSACHSAELVG